MDELYQKLLDASLHFISFRPRSEKEVRSFLLKKIHKYKAKDEDLLDHVMIRLRELGYIDDEKFTLWWIDQRNSHKPKAARLIAHELKTKGIEVKDFHLDEVDLARRAVAKKLLLWQKLPGLQQKKKIYGFLGRRGFDSETIHRIIDEIVEGNVQY